MIQFDNAIIISGTGRNVGKTTLACKLIANEKHQNIIAIKISPHQHPLATGLKLVFKNGNTQIFLELSDSTNKDSSRMKRAGATEVYYVQALDENLALVFDYFIENGYQHKLMIIESAAARRIIEPKKFLMVYSNEMPEIKPQNKDLEPYIHQWIKV